MRMWRNWQPRPDGSVRMPFVGIRIYMFFVYILRSLKNGSFYKGSTNDVYRRLVEHNSGKNKSTARYMPWELIWVL